MGCLSFAVFRSSCMNLTIAQQTVNSFDGIVCIGSVLPCFAQMCAAALVFVS